MFVFISHIHYCDEEWLEKCLTDQEKASLGKSRKANVERMGAWVLAKISWLMGDMGYDPSREGIFWNLGRLGDSRMPAIYDQCQSLEIQSCGVKNRQRELHDRADPTLTPFVVISHKFPFVLCAFMDLQSRCHRGRMPHLVVDKLIGVDIEMRQYFTENFIEFFLSDEVTKLDVIWEEWDINLYYTALWALKEACLKALTPIFKNLTVQKITIRNILDVVTYHDSNKWGRSKTGQGEVEVEISGNRYYANMAWINIDGDWFAIYIRMRHYYVMDT